MVEQQVVFQSGEATLAGMLTLPERDADGAWVFCAPLFEERKASARAMAEASRVFAEAGQAVLRFDYRGCGDAPGAFSDHTVSDWVADVRAALGFLDAENLPGSRGLLGVRFGGTLAGLAAGSRERLVLWEPVIGGDAYLAGELRRKVVREMVTFGKSQADGSDLAARMEAGEVLDLDGYAVTPRLYADVCNASLEGRTEAWSESVLAVEISHQDRMTAAFREAFSALSGSGRAKALRLQPFWNLVGYVDCNALVGLTLDWIQGKGV
jgi:alpha/beta superfamily hydrolase